MLSFSYSCCNQEPLCCWKWRVLGIVFIETEGPFMLMSQWTSSCQNMERNEVSGYGQHRPSFAIRNWFRISSNLCSQFISLEKKIDFKRAILSEFCFFDFCFFNRNRKMQRCLGNGKWFYHGSAVISSLCLEQQPPPLRRRTRAAVPERMATGVECAEKWPVTMVTNRLAADANRDCSGNSGIWEQEWERMGKDLWDNDVAWWREMERVQGRRAKTGKTGTGLITESQLIFIFELRPSGAGSLENGQRHLNF